MGGYMVMVWNKKIRCNWKSKVWPLQKRRHSIIYYEKTWKWEGQIFFNIIWILSNVNLTRIWKMFCTYIHSNNKNALMISNANHLKRITQGSVYAITSRDVCLLDLAFAESNGWITLIKRDGAFQLVHLYCSSFGLNILAQNLPSETLSRHHHILLHARSSWTSDLPEQCNPPSIFSSKKCESYYQERENNSII